MARRRRLRGASLNSQASVVSSSRLLLSTVTLLRLSPHRLLVFAKPKRSSFSRPGISSGVELLIVIQTVTPGLSLFRASSRELTAELNLSDAVFRVFAAAERF